MCEIELCRLCANMADQTNVEKLFERNQRKLLRQIEELIGQRLKNAKYLPQNICKPCEERTLQAHAFRAQCIRAQQHFALQKKKECSQQRKRKLKEEVSPIEEVVLNELGVVKVERLDDETAPTTLPDITEVMLKNEPINADDFSQDSVDSFNLICSDDVLKADDCDDSFNPLDEDYHNFTDEDMMTIEPEISLLTVGEEALPKDNELKPQTKKKSSIKKEKGNGTKCASTEERKIKKEKGKRTKNVSNEEKPFICDQCGKNFKVNSLLEAHLRRHAGERKFKCEVCPDSFFLNSDLKRHMQKHAGELPYSCSHCERRFLDKSHAKKHERTHTNERPFVCQQCGKAFTVSHILKAHMLVHTGERAFGCKLCNAAFKLKKHLVTHYRSMTHKQNEEKYQLNMSNQTIFVA